MWRTVGCTTSRSRTSERNQKKHEKFFGLAATLRRFGCDSMGVEEKDAMRELILRGGPYTPQQKEDIVDYCESDVKGLDALLPKLLSKIDIRRAIARGSYIIEIAKIEDRGIPIDVPRLETIRVRRDELILHLVSQHRHIDVYEGTTFDQKKFEAFLVKNGLAERWRRTATGLYKSDDSYFEEMGEVYPLIEELRQLKKIVLQLQRDRFQAGADDRARCPLWSFSSITGRNQPSAGKEQKDGIRSESPYVFGLPKALRFLIRPAPEMALAYIDWEQQEFMIAAFMSGDKEMIRAYRSGNPYLALAKKLGAVPESRDEGNTSPRARKIQGCGAGSQLWAAQARAFQSAGTADQRMRETPPRLLESIFDLRPMEENGPCINARIRPAVGLGWLAVLARRRTERPVGAEIGLCSRRRRSAALGDRSRSPQGCANNCASSRRDYDRSPVMKISKSTCGSPRKRWMRHAARCWVMLSAPSARLFALMGATTTKGRKALADICEFMGWDDSTSGTEQCRPSSPELTCASSQVSAVAANQARNEALNTLHRG